MTDRPILFSAPMVRALLDGRKSQTRRIIKPQPDHCHRDIIGKHPPYDEADWNRLLPQLGEKEIPLRFAKGDRLWVREAWRAADEYHHLPPRELPDGDGRRVHYEAGYGLGDWQGWEIGGIPGRLRAGMYMPRWASRLTLAVTDVRVQRLLEIDADDAAAEGLFYVEDGPGAGFWLDDKEGALGICGDGSIEAYAQLWEYINGAGSWDANPWVCAISFEIHHLNIGEMDK